MTKKRITAPFYSETKAGIRYLFRNTLQPDGSLYARGRYATKIKPDDLPEHYIKGTIFKVEGYITVFGIKDIVYKPNYHINHMHRDDFLYISYDRPIRWETDARGFTSYFDYDAILWGHMILDFIRAVRRWNSYDIEDIAEEVKKKEVFFLEKYPEESKNLGKSYLLE